MHSIIRGLKVTAYGKNKVPCSQIVIVLILLLSGRDKLHFFTSSTLSRNGEILFTLKGAGQRSAGSPHTLEKNRGGSQWLFNTVCLWPLLSQSTEHRARMRQADAAVPWACGRWRATHPRGASRPQGLTVTVREAWAGKHGEKFCAPLSLNPPQHVSLQLNEKQSFQNSLHTGCNYSTGGTTKLGKVSLLQSLVESLVSHHIIKSQIYTFTATKPQWKWDLYKNMLLSDAYAIGLCY